MMKKLNVTPIEAALLAVGAVTCGLGTAWLPSVEGTFILGIGMVSALTGALFRKKRLSQNA